MQATELLNKGLSREYNVKVSATEIENALNAKLASMRNLRIKGFRPGKEPLSVVKKQYSSSVMPEVLDDIVNKTSSKLLIDNKFNLAKQPDIEIINFKEEEGLEYKIKFELFPEINIPDFSKISVEKYVCEISEEDIQESLDNLAKSSKNFVPSDKKTAEKGDTVLIDFEGKLDGVPFEGGKGTDYKLELGSGHFIPGFEDQLVKAKAGSNVTVKVRFPENYGSKNLAGKDSEFDVHVKEIHVSAPVEVNDEFAQRFNVSGLDELKEKIKTQLQSEAEKLSAVKTRKELFDKMEPLCDFALPESMIEDEHKSIVTQLDNIKKENSKLAAKSDEEIKQLYEKMSKRRVALGMLIAEVGKIEKIAISQDELREAVYNQARNFPGQEHQIFDFYRKNPKMIETLKGPILEDKAVDLILSKIQIEEKKTNFKNLIEIAQITDDNLFD
jgi:trigger factor